MKALPFTRDKNQLCWASSALGKLTMQRERWRIGGMMGAEKKEINTVGGEVDQKDANCRCLCHSWKTEAHKV